MDNSLSSILNQVPTENNTSFEESLELMSNINAGENPDKPNPTHYNSELGRIEIDGSFYYNGDVGPEGEKIIAPSLSIKEWSLKYEKFDIDKMVQNPRTGKMVETQVKIPSVMNALDCLLYNEIAMHDMVLILAFRGAHKSTNGMRYVKRQILDNGVSVAYFASSSDLATEYAEEIKTEITTNPDILNDYGYIVDDKKTSRKNQMSWIFQRGSASREPGLATGSSPTGTKGKSRIGGHPKLIVCDDIIGEEQEGSETLRKKVSTWFWKQIWPMRKENTKFIVIGTMKDPEDIYAEIIDKEIMEVVKIRAIEEWPNDGQNQIFKEPKEKEWYYTRYKKENERKPKIRGVANLKGGRVGFTEYRQNLWNFPGRVQYYIDDDESLGLDHNRMSLQEFLLIRHEQGKAPFEYEYQLNAVPVDEGYLAWDKIKYFNVEDEGIPSREDLHENVFAFFDQAFGAKNKADYNCISVVSRVDDGDVKNYYLIGMKTWKGGSVPKKIEMVEGIMKAYPYIQSIGIEADAANAKDTLEITTALPELNIIPIYQRHRKKEDDEGMNSSKVVYKLPSDIKSTKKAKILRILDQLDAVMELGCLYIWNGIDKETLDKLEACRNFPKCKKFDPIDSWGSAVEMCTTISNIKNDFFWESSLNEIN